jgi:hypothetical protein
MTTSILISERCNVPDVKKHFTLDDLLIQPDPHATSGLSFYDLQANALIQSIFESSGKKELSYTYIAQEIDKNAPTESIAQWVAVKASAFGRLEKQWSSQVDEALEHVSSLPRQRLTLWSRAYLLVAESVKTIFVAAIFSAMSVGIIGLLIAYSDDSQAIVVSMATLNVEQWASATESLKYFAIGMGVFTVIARVCYLPFVTEQLDSIGNYLAVRIQTIFQRHPMFERSMKFALLAITFVAFASVVFLTSTGKLKPANTLSDQPVSKGYSSVAIQLEDGTTKTGPAAVIRRDDGAWEVQYKD